jgi:hypothetical protein
MKLESLSIPQMVELNSGVDALYCSSRNPIPTEFFDLLLTYKAKAGEDELGLASIDLNGVPFEVSSRSWGKYPICISHEFGQVGFSLSQKLPNLRLQVRAKYLHSVGPRRAIDWFSEVLKQVSIHPMWTPSRIDLFADFQGWNPTAEDKERIVMRASNLKMNEDRNVFTGFEIGRRKTGTINARIYDKTKELESKPNGWTRIQWGSRYDPELPVWRFEYEFHTSFFREAEISTTEQALNRLNELWAYANDIWFTIREIGEDLNKSRWAISQEWKQIQKASLRGSAVPIERIRDTEKKLSLERLIPGLHGYVTSVGAKLGATNLKTCLEVVGEVLRLAEENGKISTTEKLILKKRKYAL